MQLPLQITFRNLDRSEAIETSIREHAEKLEKYCDRITGCRVIVDAPHKHHQQGNHYHVRIDVTAPDAEFVASREPDEHHAHTDAYVAIRDAFDAMRRQLEDYERRRRRQSKRQGETS
jgi:ribosomal subunit interface protein